jgi:hypothetical protein
MQFSEIQHILRNAVCAPPPSPAINPIKLDDLEKQFAATSEILRLDAMEDASAAPAFAGPPVVSKKRAFEEIFGEDSDEDSEDEDNGGLVGREAHRSEESHATSLRAIQEYNTLGESDDEDDSKEEEPGYVWAIHMAQHFARVY